MRWLLLAIAACGYNPTAAPPADAPPPDMPADALPADKRCMAKYGGLDSYELCTATETTCTFYVHTNDGNCMMACGGVGGTCMKSRDANCLDIEQHPDHPCTETHGDQVCFCTN